MNIGFLGDCVLKTPHNHKIGTQLQNELSECGIIAINFEAPISCEAGVAIHKSGPHHNQSSDAPAWLERCGVNVVSLANNHIMDYGVESLNATINSFEHSKTVGVGNYTTAYNPTVIELDGVKIAFFAATHQEFGGVDIRSTDSIGTANATSSKLLLSIKKAAEVYDRVFVIVHAGIEYLDAPLPEWREIYKSYIDMGADGVIGSHPHVPQGWEIYQGKPIIYSLGNFLFEIPERPKLWYHSNLAIIDSHTLEVRLIPLHYDYQNKIVDVDYSGDSQQHNDYLVTLLNHDKQYNEYIDKSIRELKRVYEGMLRRGGNMEIREKMKNLIRPLLGKPLYVTDSVHFLNMIQCESHRWVTERLIKEGLLKLN